MKKLLIRIGVIAAVLLVVTVTVSAYSLGNAVKKGIETGGSKVAQVEVRLDKAEVWLILGKARIKDLVVGNPAGWKSKVAVQVDDITVRVIPTSVFASKPIIDSIVIKSPDITFEGSLKNNNLSQIRNNVHAYLAGPESSTPAPVEAPASPKASRRFQLNSLLITGAKLHVRNLFSSGENVTLPLPDIHLVNLGAGPNGITSPEVAQRTLNAVLDVIAESASDVVGKLGQDAVSGAKKFNFEKAAERLKSLFGQ